MPSAGKYIPRYTVEDYQHWQGDWELWDGLAVSMTPSPFGGHSNMMMELGSIFRNAIKADHQCKTLAKVYAELDWVISPNTIVRPDLSIVCGPLIEKHINKAPAIVVELLSDSTRDRDLNHKRLLYQTEGVPYYLIADPTAKSLTQLRLEDGTYREVANEQTARFTISESCSFEISIEEAFA